MTETTAPQLATPRWTIASPDSNGAGVEGQQIDECRHCGRSISRWQRPKQTGHSRSWTHDWSSSEYCR